MSKSPIEAQSEFGRVANPIEVRRAGVSYVVQSDDGRYRLGINDDGFETQTFAASVLAMERPPPGPEKRSPAAANDGANRKIKEQPADNTKSPRLLQLHFSGGAA